MLYFSMAFILWYSGGIEAQLITSDYVDGMQVKNKIQREKAEKKPNFNHIAMWKTPSPCDKCHNEWRVSRTIQVQRFSKVSEFMVLIIYKLFKRAALKQSDLNSSIGQAVWFGASLYSPFTCSKCG